MEIEIVLLEIDKTEIVKKLVAMGAKQVFDDDMKQYSYHTPSKDRLRVRQEGEKTILNLKQKAKIEGTKASEEREVEVESFEKMTGLIEHLGATFRYQLQKHRTSFEYKEFHVAIDKYQGEWQDVPTFMEIEGPDKESLFTFAQQLGFAEKDIKDWTTRKIMKHYSSLKRD